MESTTYIWAEGGDYRLSTLLKRTRYCVAVKKKFGKNGSMYTIRKENGYTTEEEAVEALKKMARRMGLKVLQQVSYHSIGPKQFDRSKLVEYFPGFIIINELGNVTLYNYTDVNNKKSELAFNSLAKQWTITIHGEGYYHFKIPPTNFRDFAHDLERCGVHIEQKHQEPVEEIVTL